MKSKKENLNIHTMDFSSQKRKKLIPTPSTLSSIQKLIYETFLLLFKKKKKEPILKEEKKKNLNIHTMDHRVLGLEMSRPWSYPRNRRTHLKSQHATRRGV